MEGTPIVPAQNLTKVSTTIEVPLGTRIRTGGNEYIYLKGVANTAANDFVTFDEDFATALLVPDAVGQVAIAQAATVASTYGWYLIYGLGTGNNADTVSGDLPAYIGAVSGSADDLAVSGDLIRGAIWRGTSAVTGAGVAIQLNYPFVINSNGL